MNSVKSKIANPSKYRISVGDELPLTFDARIEIKHYTWSVYDSIQQIKNDIMVGFENAISLT